MSLTLWCFGTAAPASTLLHGSHYALTAGGVAGVAWLIAPGSWIARARRAVGGPDAREGTFWLTLAVTASAAAAIIHLLVVPGHLRPEAGRWLAPAFLIVALLQAGWAYAVADRASETLRGGLLLPLGISLQAGAVAAWLVSRTVGLPAALYPGPVPAVGLPDLLAVLCQTAAVAAAVVLWRTPAPVGASTVAAGAISDAPHVAEAPRLTRWAAWPPASRLTAVAAGGGIVALITSGGLL